MYKVILFYFCITFYLNRSRAKRRSKGVFDVSLEWDFPRQSKHISDMFDNVKVKKGRDAERRNSVCRHASLYQKFASVEVREKGDDDMAALGK